MTRPFADQTGRRRRLLRIVIVVVIGAFFILGWRSQSAIEVIDLDHPRRVVIVTDAGPVEIVQGERDRLLHHDSWLLQRPTVEIGSDNDEAVIRVRCQSLLPCRSTLTVETTPGLALVVIALDGVVSVTSFDGELTVFSDHSEVFLGPVSGSARVVSGTGRVSAYGLHVAEMTVNVERAPIELEFAASPRSVVLTSGSGTVALAVPDTGYDMVIRTEEPWVDLVDVGIVVDPDAESAVSIRGAGPIRVEPFSP